MGRARGRGAEGDAGGGREGRRGAQRGAPGREPGGGGAGEEWREAPAAAGLRRAKRAARRLQRRGPLGTPSPPRIWRRRGSYLTWRLGSASGELAVAWAGRRVPACRAPARRPPDSVRVLAVSRKPGGRRSIPGGARCSAPPTRAGTMEPELVPRRRGAGGGLPSAARGLQTSRPPSPEPSDGASRFW